MNIQFSADTLSKINTLIGRYPPGKGKSAILPLLHMAQVEFGGYLSRESMDYVAKILNIQPIEVYEVATFYTMFHMSPTGKYVLEVCRTGPCALVGAEQIINYLKSKLNVELNQTTDDGLFTIKEVECLASCGTGPMLQVGECYVEQLTESKIDQLIDSLRDGQPIDHEPNNPHSIYYRSLGDRA